MKSPCPPARRIAPAIVALLLPLGEAARGQEVEPRLLGVPRAEYRARREALMKAIREAEPGPRGRGPVAVLVGRAGEPLDEGRYRQKSDFAYLTGVDAPFAALILLPGKGEATLYLPPDEAGHGAMSVAPDGPGSASAEKYGFARVESTDSFLSDLFRAIGDPMTPGSWRSRGSAVYTVAGPRSAADDDARFERFLREGAPSAEFKDVAPLIAEMRKAKSPAELDLLRRAIAVTGAAQEEVARSIRPGLAEYQLEAKVLGTFVDRGSRRPGFSAIIGSGPNSTIPHYFANRRTIAAGDLVVVDIGAEYEYYTADITRTYPADGTFTPRQREVYQLVLDAQRAAEAEMKPGQCHLREMTRFVRDFFRKSPLRARDRDGDEQTMDHFFIHGLGHYLGMDVHDVGDYSKPVQVGEVFTIEPGLYIPSEDLGVRIEDDYVMTEHGPEKLSKDIPSDPDEVERAIARGRSRREAD